MGQTGSQDDSHKSSILTERMTQTESQGTSPTQGGREIRRAVLSLWSWDPGPNNYSHVTHDNVSVNKRT